MLHPMKRCFRAIVINNISNHELHVHYTDISDTADRIPDARLTHFEVEAIGSGPLGYNRVGGHYDLILLYGILLLFFNGPARRT